MPTREHTPGPVNGGLTFQSLSAGVYHTCGITLNGDAYCWGSNYYGKLGLGFESYRETTPRLVLGGQKFQSIRASYQHTCGLSKEGTIYCWGRNNVGQLGLGYPSPFESSPRPVIDGHIFRSVSAGAYHTCGITTDGDAYCWGSNMYSQLGDGTPTSNPFPSIWESSPVAVIGGHTFQTLGLGWQHSCGVTTGGDAYCWGNNWHGQLGILSVGYPTSEAEPQLVAGGQFFRSVSGGRDHSCGVTTANEAFCWGRNNYGQVGDGTYITRPSPEFALDLNSPSG